MFLTVLIILGACLLIIQTTVLARMPPWLGNPDLLFLLVLFIAVRVDTFRGIILVMIYGLMMDIFSGFVPGLYPAVYLGLFLTIRYASSHVIVDEPVHLPPLAAASYLFCSGAIFLYMTVFNPGTDILWSWRDLLLQMFILAILALPSFHVLGRITARIASDRRRIFSTGKGGNRFIS